MDGSNTMKMRQDLEIERLRRLYAALGALNQTITRATSREGLFHQVCRIVIERAGFKVAWVGWPDPETHRVIPVARAGDDERYVDEIEIFADDRPEGRGPAGTCIRERRPCVFNDFLEAPRAAPWHVAAIAHSVRAAASLPIHDSDGNYGALTVYDGEPDSFQDREMELLREVAAGISLALERLEHEAERNRAEEALRAANRAAEASRAQYEQVVSMISDVTWRYEVDSQGRFVNAYISPVADRLLGLPAGAIDNNFDKYFSCILPEDLPAVQETLSAVLRTNAKDTIAEYRLRRSDGSILWVRSKGSAYPQADGHVVAFGTTSDISDRKRAEQSLQQSETRYRSLFDGSPTSLREEDYSEVRRYLDHLRAAGVTDFHDYFEEHPEEVRQCAAKVKVLDVNQAGLTLCGATDRQDLLRGLAELFTDETYDTFRQALLAVADGKTGFDVEVPIRTLRGEKKQVLLRWATAPGSEQSYAKIYVAQTDITDRKRAEEALRKNEAMLSCILNSLPLSIFWKDRDSVYLGCNETFAKRAGCRPRDLLGKSDFDLSWSREDSEAYRADDRQVMVSGRARAHIIERQHRPDGTCIWIDTTKLPLLDAEGNVYGMVGVYDDITERKQMEDALRKAKDAADAANRAKSEFLANMSHEIRTPMTAILGFADMLVESVMCCEECPKVAACQRRSAGRESVNTIRRNGEHLMNVIGDILDLSKIEADKIQIKLIPCSPVQLAAEVASLMRPQAAAKQLKLKTELAGPLPETVLTDPLRLRQVLVNLLGNAIKFTDQGEVRLVVRLTNEIGSPRLRFDVIDTGIGMNEEQLKSLFQPFTQVDSSSTRKFGGTGLGLCISKHLAEAMGGSIEVHSTPGGGSVFSMVIDAGPLAEIHLLQNAQEALLDRPASAPATAAATITLQGRILLAEDGPDNQRLICLLLRKAGAEVTAVENGRLAVEAALAARAAGEPFDVILMDMQMSVMDGYTAAQELRNQGYDGPIIALTAHAMTGDSQKCLDAGCDGYAAKPIDRKTLLATVAPWLSGQRPPSTATVLAGQT